MEAIMIAMLIVNQNGPTADLAYRCRISNHPSSDHSRQEIKLSRRSVIAVESIRELLGG
jgi:hypothetical protein